MLGTLGRLFSSLLSSLPPTVGDSLLTVSVPDVTKEAVEDLLALYKQEWGEVKVKREVVELADMLGMPLVNLSDLQTLEKKVGVGGENKEVEETTTEADEKGEPGVEDNSDDEAAEEEPDKTVAVEKIKVEQVGALLDPKKIKTEIDEVFGNVITAKRADKKKNTIDAMFRNLEMKIQTKQSALKENNLQESHNGPETPEISEVDKVTTPACEEPGFQCHLCDSMSSTKDELRIHIGEVHLEEQLESELLKIFPRGCEVKCAKCGQRVEAEYVKKEHILTEHPWTGLIELVENENKVQSVQLEDYNEDDVFEDESSDDEGGVEESKNSETNDKEEGKWYAGVKYKCNHCIFNAPQSGTVRNHLKKVHGFLAGDDLANQFVRTSAPLYTCKICDQSVRREYVSIFNHMKSRHKMTLARYGNEYEIKCDEGQMTLKRKRRALNSFVRIKKLKVEEEEKARGETTIKENMHKKQTITKEDNLVKENIEFSDSSGDEEQD